MTESTPHELTVGVLEPGHPHSGIRRYAEVIAQGLSAGDALTVTELSLTPDGRGLVGLRQAVAIVRRFRRHDALVIPYTRWHVWSPTASRVLQLLIVHLGLRRRTVTVMHDVYAPGGPNRVEWWAIACSMLFSGQVVLHSEPERARLRRRLPGRGRAHVIPHFVLAREGLPDREQVRAELGVAPGAVIAGMVGWLNPRKNYELVIEALARSGPEVELWIIGGAGAELEWYEQQLRELAAERSVADRVTITGSLPEPEFERRLAAIDVGVCPYRRISASGSVSTLLGARRPVVVSQVDFAHDLHELAPDVVHTLTTLEPDEIAAAIQAMAAHPADPREFERLLTARSVASTAARYRERIAALAR